MHNCLSALVRAICSDTFLISRVVLETTRSKVLKPDTHQLQEPLCIPGYQSVIPLQSLNIRTKRIIALWVVVKATRWVFQRKDPVDKPVTHDRPQVIEWVTEIPRVIGLLCLYYSECSESLVRVRIG